MVRLSIGGSVRAGLGCLGIALLMAGCSALLDPTAEQCHTSEDCTRFRADSVCDVTHHVCIVAPDVGMDAGAACPAEAIEGHALFVSSCTRATCVPFDNARRLTRFSADGTLAPLPVKP